MAGGGKQGGKQKPLKAPKAAKKELDEVRTLEFLLGYALTLDFFPPMYHLIEAIIRT